MRDDAVDVVLRDVESPYATKLRFPHVLQFDELRRRVSNIRCLPADCFTLTLREKTLCDQADVKLRDGDVLIINLVPTNDNDNDEDDDNDFDEKQLNYNPWSGLSDEEVEWRLGQRNRVHQRMQKAMRELRIQALAMRQPFQNDPHALCLWDEYTDYIEETFARSLEYKLSCPMETPNSVLYDHLMKKKAHPKPSAMVFGLPSLFKQVTMKNVASRTGARIAGVAAVFAAAMVFGLPSLSRKPQRTP
ncbi:uncharacterized protein LOC133900701 [Phragmites australis]|uniref:uncharacterized protein LOC133900701 n=1 Tax=Phragmites australis TaxID=29695 RepID=UPI002D767FE7|nr:uncharacterized protein LOC133900701 [Phragmites australis]